MFPESPIQDVLSVSMERKKRLAPVEDPANPGRRTDELSKLLLETEGRRTARLDSILEKRISPTGPGELQEARERERQRSIDRNIEAFEGFFDTRFIDDITPPFMESLNPEDVRQLEGRIIEAMTRHGSFERRNPPRAFSVLDPGIRTEVPEARVQLRHSLSPYSTTDAISPILQEELEEILRDVEAQSEGSLLSQGFRGGNEMIERASERVSGGISSIQDLLLGALAASRERSLEEERALFSQFGPGPGASGPRLSRDPRTTDEAVGFNTRRRGQR